MTTRETVSVLRLTLHGVTVGFLAGYQSGQNTLTFTPEFRDNDRRPTLSLTTHPDFPGSKKVLAEPWITRQRLHPVLSNMLPEGGRREDVAKLLKIHVDNEFPLMSYLGGDLPGALIATPLDPADIPSYALEHRKGIEPIPIPRASSGIKFSLAGIQNKFSMRGRDGTYDMPPEGELGDWIVKPPSSRHAFVPLNEFTAMSLARTAGVEIPEIKLVPMTDLSGLPPLNLPAEEYAYAVRRFDRTPSSRIHIEDFAQVLVRYPADKYGQANYEQFAKVLHQFTGQSLANVQQFARRLLVNILLANGDAHLKNWSLIYPDAITAELAPAYDIVTTKAYVLDEQDFALKLGKVKEWYTVGYANFQRWAERAQIPWRAIEPHLEDTLDKARNLWPQQLTSLPMAPEHKRVLISHWQQLNEDFRIRAELQLNEH